MPKILIISKNAPNKSLKIKFPAKKSEDIHVYLPQEWSQGSKDYDVWNKYYNALKWENRSTLGFKATKSMDCKKKCFE